MVHFSNMTEEKTQTENKGFIETLFGVGAHLGYSRARRHASMKTMIFGSKSNTDIIDLTRTAPLIEESLGFIRTLGAQGKTVLFVGGKPEIRDLVRETTESLNMPFVAGRWLGGTLTNFAEIKKRIQRLGSLTADKEAGVLAQKYTKKERLLIDREIIKLEESFGGMSGVEQLPQALVVVDTRAENIAVTEAQQTGIPVVGIMNSDCDLRMVDHPIIGNDASRKSVSFFLEKIAEAYQAGKKEGVKAPAKEGS